MYIHWGTTCERKWVRYGARLEGGRERESARMSVGHMTAVEQLVFHVSVKVATLPYLPRKAGRVRDLAL